ncbi:MAG TPA: histidine phosphatase family protein [Rhodocyclaceae bacterium]
MSRDRSSSSNIEAVASAATTDHEAKTTMDILLWRHAEAEDGAEDMKRKLTARGEKQARCVAVWIREHSRKNLRVLVSPSVRTQQTATALDLPYETDRHLAPGARPTDLLAACGWPDGDDSRSSVLVVGHQPTLGELAALLMTGHVAPWSVKKGALWWLTRKSRGEQAQIVLRTVIDPALL